MASGDAWNAGWNLGAGYAQQRSAHKQALSDEELQGKIQDLIGQRSALVSKISDLDKDSPEYKQAFDALKQVNSGLVDIYHPNRNPSAISRFGHLLTDHLGIRVNGETLPQRRKDKADAQAAQKDKTATTQAEQQVAGAPLSPSEEAAGKAKADLASIQAAAKNFQTLNPDASEEQKQGFLSDLIQKTYGTNLRGNWTNIAGKMNGQPVTLLFDKNTHQYRLQNGEAVPQEMLATFIPDTKTTEVDKERGEYDEAVKNGYKGSFIQYKAEQAGLGRNAAVAAKPPNRDDRYIAILQKASQHQPLTPDELAYKAAYDMWVQKTKVEPGVARAAAFSDDRYTWVYDLNDPNKNLHPMRYKDAAKAPIGSPANIAFKTDAAITRAFTSGPAATTINYFNTAIEHLNLLKDATDALNNGNVQLFNKYANAWASATGNPAPNNFDTVRNAVAGELSKTFKGTGATDEEIANISGTINSSQSPDQLYGGIDYDLRLMQGKMDALKGQFQKAKQGQPNFPTTSATPSGTQGDGKQKVSIAKAKLKPQYKNLTDDQVKQAIEASGKYVAVP